MGSNAAARLDQKVLQGEETLAALAPFSATPGCDKLSRKVAAEMRFLQKLRRQPHTLKEDHLRSSNMERFAALVATLQSVRGVSALMAAFSTADPAHRLVVDVVADHGATWVKVISRNPRALQRVSLGQGEYGQKSALDQARQYVAAAARNPHYFRAPAVRFVFSAGVGRRLAARLLALGVFVVGECIDDDQLGVTDDGVGDSSDDDDVDVVDPVDAASASPVGGRVDAQPARRPLARESTGEEAVDGGPADVPSADGGPTETGAAEPALNLDVTSLLAYVSNLTNGRCHVTFAEPVLAQQAAWERRTPVKAQLDRLFADRRLVCCRSAQCAFASIVATVGGPAERRRADALLARLRVVDDLTSPATALLEARGKVRRRSAAVFGTGEALRVPTVTANSGFVRAAAGQGVHLTALIHGSRALTEAKEIPAAVESCDTVKVVATERRATGSAAAAERGAGGKAAVECPVQI